MQRVKHPSTGCPSDPNQSLFKFRLHFHSQTTEYASKNGKPWVWYSFDKADERAMFPPGLERELRALYSELLFQAYRWPDLYSFMKECYPVWRHQPDQDSKLIVYMPQHMISTARDVSARFTETIDFLTDKLGITAWNMDYLEKGRTVPGHSPSRKKNFEYYGLEYFKRNPGIAKWFFERKLQLVEVFDNRCYHVDNLFDTIDLSHFPEPTNSSSPRLGPATPSAPAPNPAPQAWNVIPSGSTPAPSQPSLQGRINKSASVGSLLAHFPKQ